VRQLQEQHWAPPDMTLPAQVERILEIHELDQVTCAVVEAAREGLVIGQV